MVTLGLCLPPVGGCEHLSHRFHIFYTKHALSYIVRFPIIDGNLAHGCKGSFRSYCSCAHNEDYCIMVTM